MKSKNNIKCVAMIIAVMSLSFTGCGSKGETETEMSTEAVTETVAEVATETEAAVETTEELTSESAEADEENDKPQISYIAIEEKAKGEERIREAEERAEAERQVAEAEQTTETQTTQAKTTEAQTAQTLATETPAPANTTNSNSSNTETHGDGYNIPGPVSNILSSGRGYSKHWLCDENGNMIESTVWYDDIYGYAYDINGNYEGWNIYDY